MNAFVPDHAIIWAEIPVTDMERAKAFYAAVLQNTLVDDDPGPNPISMFVVKEKGRAGHLYPGKPAAPGTGSTVHLAVPAPLEDAMERLEANGGSVVTPVIEIPAGRFAYCLDPDGNSIGLFSPSGA
ncbi:VOC family protein [Mesorhizobium xinjiangense]|uniref:VOC family protein n=1 Tax=Mesorhizobium xinjiangense TaxID=2678685 RepID=UPI0012EE832F|nr:VOC family protein [Mesorhizobium xinjiangense]